MTHSAQQRKDRVSRRHRRRSCAVWRGKNEKKTLLLTWCTGEESHEAVASGPLNKKNNNSTWKSVLHGKGIAGFPTEPYRTNEVE